MNNLNSVIKFKIPFKSKSYDTNFKTHKKAFVKGDFIITMNRKYELILDVILQIEELGIDIYNTCKWFRDDLIKKNKEDEFNIRKKFLALSGIDVLPRFSKGNTKQPGCINHKRELICGFNHQNLKSKDQNKIVHFSSQNEKDKAKLIQFENWFNDYKISFKGLDKIISGSNPSGSVKNPQANPLVLNTKDWEINKKYHNFGLIMEKIRINKRNDFDLSGFKHLQTYSFLEIINNKKIPFLLEKLFDFSNKIPSIDKQNRLQRIRNKKNNAEINYKKSFEIWKLVQKGRYEFVKNMDGILETKPDIVKKIDSYQRCHIKPVSHIKKNMENSYLKTGNLNQAKAMVKEIASMNNGIFLTTDDHNLFDRGKSYIDINDGKMYFSRSDKKPHLVIKKRCLNPERKEFLLYHKEYVYGRGIRKGLSNIKQ